MTTPPGPASAPLPSAVQAYLDAYRAVCAAKAPAERDAAVDVALAAYQAIPDKAQWFNRIMAEEGRIYRAAGGPNLRRWPVWKRWLYWAWQRIKR
jgi:hypothetical protein